MKMTIELSNGTFSELPHLDAGAIDRIVKQMAAGNWQSFGPGGQAGQTVINPRHVVRVVVTADL